MGNTGSKSQESQNRVRRQRIEERLLEAELERQRLLSLEQDNQRREQAYQQILEERRVCHQVVQEIPQQLLNVNLRSNWFTAIQTTVRLWAQNCENHWNAANLGLQATTQTRIRLTQAVRLIEAEKKDLTKEKNQLEE